jgi:hypothetical protein
MGALGGHRRFCGQLSTAVARAPVLCEDSTLSAEDGGAEAVALPTRVASSLPPELHPSLLCAYDFATYFYKAIVPAATMLEVRASVLKREEGESELPPPPPPAEMALFDPEKHARVGDTAKGAALKKKKKKGAVEEDLSVDVRQMLCAVQASSWSDWEAMFSLAPGEDLPAMVHALHLLSVHLLLVDLLEPNKITAGPDFCARLGEASRRLLNGNTLCPYTWPELLRMVLLARSVAQAPKKRAVALNAMMLSGHGSASVAFAASAALGGGHSISVWSAAPSVITKGASSSSAAATEGVDAPAAAPAEEEEGEMMSVLGEASEWSPVIDALENVDEYASLSVYSRCLITECVVQLLSETSLCSKFFDMSAKVRQHQGLARVGREGGDGGEGALCSKCFDVSAKAMPRLGLGRVRLDMVGCGGGEKPQHALAAHIVTGSRVQVLHLGSAKFVHPCPPRCSPIYPALTGPRIRPVAAPCALPHNGMQSLISPCQRHTAHAWSRTRTRRSPLNAVASAAAPTQPCAPMPAPPLRAYPYHLDAPMHTAPAAPAHPTPLPLRPQVHDKLQDLKRTEYKNRNAQIEEEEQAKLAAKYNIERPVRLSHDRAGARDTVPKVRASASRNGAGKVSPAAELSEGAGSKEEAGAATHKAQEAGVDTEAAGEEESEEGVGDASVPASLSAVPSIVELAAKPSVSVAGSDAGDAALAGGARASPELRGADTEPGSELAAGEVREFRDSPVGGSVVGGDEEGTEPHEDEEGAGGGGGRRRDADGKRKRFEQASKAAQHVRRGDLDQMRIRKDELRKQLDDDFLVLAGRIGRLRQEPIGLDRDRREYMVLGGPADGQQPGADLSRLLIRERPPRGAEGRETWRSIRCAAASEPALPIVYLQLAIDVIPARKRAHPTLPIAPPQ